ncbi:hypothetical protein D3C85_1295450 [compost metagenome]
MGVLLVIKFVAQIRIVNQVILKVFVVIKSIAVIVNETQFSSKSELGKMRGQDRICLEGIDVDVLLIGIIEPGISGWVRTSIRSIALAVKI